MNKNQPPATPHTITIGSAEGNTIRLDKNGISRQHAKITVETNGSYLLEDLDSKHGTFVNGIQLKKRKVTLEDKVAFGSHEYLLKDLLIQAKVIEKPKDPLDFTEEFAELEKVYEDHERFKGEEVNIQISNKQTRDKLVVFAILFTLVAAFITYKTGQSIVTIALSSVAPITIIPLLGSYLLGLDKKLDVPRQNYANNWKCPKCGDKRGWRNKSWEQMASQKKCKKCNAIWVK